MSGFLAYRDKSTGRSVRLPELATDFLVLLRRGEAERLPPVLDQRAFTVERPNRDTLVLTQRSQAESSSELRSALQRLVTDPAVRSVYPAVIDTSGERRFVMQDRVSVMVRPGGAAVLEGLAASLGAPVLHRGRTGRLFVLGLPEGETIGSFIDQLNTNDEVELAEPAFVGVGDQELQARVTLGTQRGEGEAIVEHPYAWNLERISAFSAWAHTRGSPRILIGLVDGIPQTSHPALAGRFVAQPSDALVFGDTVTETAHATAIAGLLVGASDTFVGVAPDCRLLPLAVDLNAQLYSLRAEAILEAARLASAGELDGQGFDRIVLSCSWRTAGDVSVIRLALSEAVRAGILVVCSAGNDATDAPHFPSDYGARDDVLGQGILSIAATDREDAGAPYSNHSPRIDLAAPGGNGLPIDDRDVFCPEPDDSYGFAAGTSIATPHVAAVAALLLSLDPELTPAQLKAILRDSVDPLQPGQADTAGWQMGTGRLNAARAIASLTPPAMDEARLPAPAPAAGPRVVVEVTCHGSSTAEAPPRRRRTGRRTRTPPVDVLLDDLLFV